MTIQGTESNRGIPGLAGAEHIGFTVPDIDEAHDFLVNVIGCEYIYTLGPYPQDPDFMVGKLRVEPDTILREIRFYRCFNGSNFEVFQFEAPNQVKTPPRNSDVGGHHIAFYVDDLDLAIDYLRDKGVELFDGPTSSSGASEGQCWIYFRSPWGMQFELVSFPNGKAYERDAEVLLWHPKDES